MLNANYHSSNPLLVQAIQVTQSKYLEKPHAISVTAVEIAAHWLVSLSDTGSGISPEHQQHLFKPFFSTREVGDGMGLGLALAHQLVDSAGGVIWAESHASKGTCFKIRLLKAA